MHKTNKNSDTTFTSFLILKNKTNRNKHCCSINPAPKLDSSLSPLSKMSNSMSFEWHLTQIGNRDIDRALEGMQHIETLLTSDQVI